MKEIKFKRFNRESKRISDVPEDCKLSDIHGYWYSKYDYLQYLGLEDANGTELYQGDIIELHVTKGLMKSSFHGTRLGEYLQKHPEVTSILLIFNNPDILSMEWQIAQKINGNFDYEEDGELHIISDDENSTIPQLLIGFGAIRIGNILEMEYIMNAN